MKYIIALIILLVIGFIVFTNIWNINCRNIPNDFNEIIQWDRGDSESPVSKCDAWLKHKEEYELIKNKTNQYTTVSVDVYLQNKETARVSDCSATEKVTTSIEINKKGIEDSVLQFLFESELSMYGEYESVEVSDGVAQIYLKSDQTPMGNPLSSLSSCEIQHLQSVLKDTLKQYLVERIELYSPKGKIDF